MSATNIRKPGHPEEDAYRRGVMHGLHALEQYLNEKRPLIGEEACLAEAVIQARAMRADRKQYEWYTHELIRRVHAMSESHDKAYFGEETQKLP